MIDNFHDFLQHYGKKGMKWGVRSNSKVSRSPSRTVYGKSPKKLTSAELDRRIKRMETEKKYNQLNKKDVGKGKEFASDILRSSGRTVATSVISGLALFAIKKAVAKKLGAEAASSIVIKKK